MSETDWYFILNANGKCGRFLAGKYRAHCMLGASVYELCYCEGAESISGCFYVPLPPAV